MIDPSTLSQWPLDVMRRQPLARSSSSPRICVAVLMVRYGTLSRRIAAAHMPRCFSMSRGIIEMTLDQKALRSSSERRPLDARTPCRKSATAASMARAVFAPRPLP
jgi:hypothetical protein